MKHNQFGLFNLKLSIVAILMILLSGCVFSPAFSQERQLKKGCELSPVLLTDLTISPNQRRYMLPNHQLCPDKKVI